MPTNESQGDRTLDNPELRDCPHCGARMLKWYTPPDLSWGTPYQYVCFNDECSYYVRGWAWIEQTYNLPGFHAWDATAALYLTDPQLFEPQTVVLRSSLEDLSRGILRFEETNGTQRQGYRMDGKHNSR